MANTQYTIPDHPDFKPLHSYSQDGEDILLRHALFATTPNYENYKGFYIDIGAHHPFKHSNTMHFYEQGWRGINVEPTPEAINLFNTYRDRDINLNIGIGSTHETKTLYCFEDSALNTFDKSIAEENAGKDSAYTVLKTAEVEIYPLAKVLDQYLPEGVTIDFMSIDVAGLDLALLQSNNWDKYRPNFVLVEDVDSSSNKADLSYPVYEFLAGKQYEQVYKTPHTLLLRQKSLA
jgi:FkbM family methyltransferase